MLVTHNRDGIWRPMLERETSNIGDTALLLHTLVSFPKHMKPSVLFNLPSMTIAIQQRCHIDFCLSRVFGTTDRNRLEQLIDPF